MIQYKNLGGNSNVHSYEIGNDYIDVMFGGGSKYRYTYESAGIENIEKMKQLAKAGQGLNSFINKVVRKLYAFKYEK